jgi:DnaK suppressor protein
VERRLTFSMKNPMSKTHLQAGDLARLRRALAQKRDELRSALEVNRSTERQALDQIESGDMAEQIIEQDDAVRAVTREASMLSEIERAIAKIDAGTYGFSELSGAAIPLERLNAMPWARRTLEEDEAFQRRKK